jgi:thiol-disulfide isomerase/thioredoxin
LWKFIKPVLPASVAAVIEKYAGKMSDFCTPYIEMIPGMKKKKKDKPTGPVSDSFEPGVIQDLTSEEHLDALLAKSKTEGFAVVLDFTASWCKPCQKIKPRYKELAAEYPNHCFVMIDCDTHDDIMPRCEVMGLPTFQVYMGGEKKESITGISDDTKLVDMLSRHLSTKKD